MKTCSQFSILPLAAYAATLLVALSAFPGDCMTAAARQQEAVSGRNAESTLPVFEFHSGFWVNLHHFLYLQARLGNGNSVVTENVRGAAAIDVPPVSLLDFPSEEIRAWHDAVAFYEKDLANRDLLLNVDMETINNRLAEMESCADLAGKDNPSCRSGLQPGLVEALDRAAAVYREHWWAAQDRENRAWIAQVTPVVQQMGVRLSAQLADVYQKSWPSGTLRVDVVGYAGPFGAYTSLTPIHVTISSHDARNQGMYGFEVLFHESSHALAGPLNETIAREFRSHDKPIPRELWHALLFYTTGELVRRDLAYGLMSLSVEGIDTRQYQPYAARFGLYSGGWERFRGELDLYWMPYLDGKVSFDTAIVRLAASQ